MRLFAVILNWNSETSNSSQKMFSQGLKLMFFVVFSWTFWTLTNHDVVGVGSNFRLVGIKNLSLQSRLKHNAEGYLDKTGLTQ